LPPLWNADHSAREKSGKRRRAKAVRRRIFVRMAEVGMGEEEV